MYHRQSRCMSWSMQLFLYRSSTILLFVANSLVAGLVLESLQMSSNLVIVLIFVYDNSLILLITILLRYSQKKKKKHLYPHIQPVYTYPVLCCKFFFQSKFVYSPFCFLPLSFLFFLTFYSCHIVYRVLFVLVHTINSKKNQYPIDRSHFDSQVNVMFVLFINQFELYLSPNSVNLLSLKRCRFRSLICRAFNKATVNDVACFIVMSSEFKIFFSAFFTYARCLVRWFNMISIHLIRNWFSFLRKFVSIILALCCIYVPSGAFYVTYLLHSKNKLRCDRFLATLLSVLHQRVYSHIVILSNILCINILAWHY